LLAGTYVLSAYYEDTLYVGCTTTDTVTITQLAAVQLLVNTTDIDCYGEATGSIVESQILGGTPPVTYNWLNGTGNPDSLYSLIADEYVVVVTDANGCEVTQTYEITEPAELIVTVNQNQTYILEAILTGGVPVYSYAWMEQSQGQIGTGNTYTVIDYGIYYVIVTDANGCIIQSNSFEYNESPTGVGDELTNLNLSIYPNPFREETTVDFGMEIKKAVISVVDVYGKQIESYIISNTNRHILKRNNKASGVYFMEIEVEERKKTIVKLIIE
jgi:hypothetical protein